MRIINNIAIIGSFPPPSGGVAIHTLRLCQLLDKRDVKYIIYNAASTSETGDRVVSVYQRRALWLLQYLFTGQERCLYIMSPRILAWLLGALMATLRKKTVIVRIQNALLIDWVKDSRIKRFFAAVALRRLDGVVCVNEMLADTINEVLGVNSSKIKVFPGFLPPAPAELDRQEIPHKTWDFVEQHTPLIVANGKIAQYRGEDLYGLDMLIDLAGTLKDNHPDVGIIFCFSDINDADTGYLEKLRQSAKAKGVEYNIHFKTNYGPFLPVLNVADIFVRPTCTDGDANSVREALCLDVPTIASDVVPRPEGTILFRNRDMADFEHKVLQTLKKRQPKTRQEEEWGAPDKNPVALNYVDYLMSMTERHP